MLVFRAGFSARSLLLYLDYLQFRNVIPSISPQIASIVGEMGWRFHRVLNVIPGMARINISKSGVSTSLGPRGADVNFGSHGATANAGIPGTGLSYRQKLGYHGSGIGVGLLIALLGFVGWRYFEHAQHAGTWAVPQSSPSATLPSSDSSTASTDTDDSGGIPTVTKESHAHMRGGDANAGADVIAAAKPASGTMYVHRNNSDLRGRPATSSPAIKKLAKGDTVTLIAVSDKWSEIQDGSIKGWVRSSIIKDTPPGAKKSRKKKSDSDSD
jgi:Protein of unknown function (DUF4236)/Bacterial SH3 domain